MRRKGKGGENKRREKQGPGLDIRRKQRPLICAIPRMIHPQPSRPRTELEPSLHTQLQRRPKQLLPGLLKTRPPLIRLPIKRRVRKITRSRVVIRIIVKTQLQRPRNRPRLPRHPLEPVFSMVDKGHVGCLPEEALECPGVAAGFRKTVRCVDSFGALDGRGGYLLGAAELAVDFARLGMAGADFAGEGNKSLGGISGCFCYEVCPCTC